MAFSSHAPSGQVWSKSRNLEEGDVGVVILLDHEVADATALVEVEVLGADQEHVTILLAHLGETPASGFGKGR